MQQHRPGRRVIRGEPSRRAPSPCLAGCGGAEPGGPGRGRGGEKAQGSGQRMARLGAAGRAGGSARSGPTAAAGSGAAWRAGAF